MSEKKSNQSAFWQSVSLAWELGYTMAIPLVTLALIGRWLDKRYEASPLFLLIGVLLSVVISSISVYKKASKILSDTPDKK